MSVNLMDELIDRERRIFSFDTYTTEVDKWKDLRSDSKLSSV